ncbi:MAG: transcription antitermination factor NusB [Spirochaetota bacterium]
MSRRKARIYAMQALFSWDISQTPLDQLLEFSWVDQKTDVQDARHENREATIAFSRLLVAGTVERIDEVDRSIERHLVHWKLERLARVDLAILRLGAYSLMFQPDIPASVTIDEAVELAREYGSDESYRFVNGVLDAIRKDLD